MVGIYSAELLLYSHLFIESGELDHERMALICDRKQKSEQKLFEINNREVYVHPDLPGKHFYTSTSGTQQASSKVALTRIEKPSIDYLKRTSSSTNKKQKTSSSRSENCSIEKLRYAPLNRTDLELICKLPSVLFRISQLYHMTKLEQLLANDSHLNPVQVNTLRNCFLDYSFCIIGGRCLSTANYHL